MAVVFEDLFTEASDTALESHTPDTGTGWTKDGTVGMTVNGAGDYCSPDLDSNGSNSAYSANYSVGTADYDVEVDIVAEGAGSDDSAGVIARMTDNQNRWAAEVYNTAGVDAIIGKRVGGVRTNVATADTDNTWTDETIRFELRGSALKLFFGATEELSVVDSDLQSDVKPGGLYTGNVIGSGNDTDVGWHFDNFKITEVDAGGTTKTVTLSLDAALEAQKTLTAALDAGLLAGRSKTTSLDAGLAGLVSRSALLDAALRELRAAAANLDAALRDGVTRDSGLDAAVAAAAAVATGLAAAVARRILVQAALDTAIRAGLTRGAALDAVLAAIAPPFAPAASRTHAVAGQAGCAILPDGRVYVIPKGSRTH